ncbi:MAG: hypothetical protein MHM6MM_000590 [Cercozoa sp. M6MM]
MKYVDLPEGAAKACLLNQRVHYKNTAEVCRAISGYSVQKAIAYLRRVIKHEDIIPFRVHTGGIGRHAQCKKYHTAQGRWPEKSCRLVLQVLQNLVANAATQGLDTEKLVLTDVMCSPARKHRRRTYRAHGRINPWMRSPCHVHVVAKSQEAAVPKAEIADSA